MKGLAAWVEGREGKQRLGSRENNEENKNQKQGKKGGGGNKKQIGVKKQKRRSV